MHLVVTLHKYYQLMLTTMPLKWGRYMPTMVWGTYMDLQLNENMLLTMSSGRSAVSDRAIMTFFTN